MPNNRSRNARRFQRRRAQPRPSFRTALNGARLRPRADVPALVTSPWNSITVAAQATQPALPGLVSIFPSTINAALISQIDAPAGSVFEFRVHSIRCWNMTGNSVGLRVFDLTNEISITPQPLALSFDLPGRNRWATTGYVYPVTQRNNALSGTESTFVIFQLEGGVAADIIHYRVNLLWRFVPNDPIPLRGIVSRPYVTPEVGFPPVASPSLSWSPTEDPPDSSFESPEF